MEMKITINGQKIPFVNRRSSTELYSCSCSRTAMHNGTQYLHATYQLEYGG